MATATEAIETDIAIAESMKQQNLGRDSPMFKNYS
jgi:hypothetical protein